MRYAFVFLCLILVACSTSRKLSRLDVRAPSSVENPTVNPLRAKAFAQEVPGSCPKEVRDFFGSMTMERVEFPPCPPSLAQNLQSARNYLKVEERTTIEEVLESHCQSLLTDFGDSLETIYLSFDSTGPIGRRSKITNTLLPMDGELKSLVELKGDLGELVNFHLPLDRWTKRNGDFLLPNEELEQLYRMVVEQSCRMTDQEIDRAYRTIRSLEEVSRVLKTGPQQKRVQTFVEGIHKVVDQKLKEYF